MKILHFALENYARVPGVLRNAERELGHESYLMTLYPSKQRFKDEDFCLNMPWVGTASWIQTIKKAIPSHAPYESSARRETALGPPVWQPPGPLASALFSLRDALWEKQIRKALRAIDIETFDVIFLDGGAGFLRNGRIVRELQGKGIQIIIGYYGSDLRTRGKIPAIEGLSQYAFTVEFDHTLLDPSLEYVFAPFRLQSFPPINQPDDGRIRIGHAPTNRIIKGTDQILTSLRILQQSWPIDIVLIENMPLDQALALKSTCHLFVDTLGELGYGISGLEALAMGIPTAVELMPDYEACLGDHPFIKVTAETLVQDLTPFIKSETLRKNTGAKSKAWVRETHDPVQVAQKILSRIQS